MSESSDNPSSDRRSSITELVRGVHANDSQARDALYAKLLPELRQWATRRLPDYARDLINTDDLVQDVMLRTLNNLPKTEEASVGLLYYLRTAALNRIRDEIRRVTRRPSPDPTAVESVAAPVPSPLDQAIGAEAAQRYEQALKTLSPRSREAVVMRLELRKGFQEIAQALDWSSANAARMAIVRAIRKMASIMEQ